MSCADDKKSEVKEIEQRNVKMKRSAPQNERSEQAYGEGGADGSRGSRSKHGLPRWLHRAP